MPNIHQGIISVKEYNKKFSGTVAFRNEKLTLPDGSKVAIGIDNERWVILYQKKTGSSFIIYEYNANTHHLLVDKKQGSEDDYKKLQEIIKHFFSNAETNDVVTIEIGRKHK